MSTTKVNPVEEFKKSYKEFQEVSEIVERLGDKVNSGWSIARDELISKKIIDPKERVVQIATMEDRDVDKLALGAIDSAKTTLESYFTKYHAPILNAIDNKSLEEIALGIRPTNLPDNDPASGLHNPLVELVKGYQKAAEMNEGMKQGKINAEDYRDYVLSGAKGILGKIIKSEKESDRAKKLYAEAIMQTIARTPASAKLAGIMIQTDKQEKIREYLASEKVSQNYSISDFARNNIAYSKPEEVIELVGKLLTPKKKK